MSGTPFHWNEELKVQPIAQQTCASRMSQWKLLYLADSVFSSQLLPFSSFIPSLSFIQTLSSFSFISSFTLSLFSSFISSHFFYFFPCSTLPFIHSHFVFPFSSPYFFVRTLIFILSVFFSSFTPYFSFFFSFLHNYYYFFNHFFHSFRIFFFPSFTLLGLNSFVSNIIYIP